MSVAGDILRFKIALTEWVGPDWDPDEFDIVAVNKELAALPTPRRPH